MRNDIINLAQEKGFEPEICSNIYEIIINHPMHYYLWLCELQKWLRDNHKINIDIEFDRHEGIDEYMCTVRNPISKYSGTNYTYEQSQEKGCFEALKLIK